MHDEPTSGTNLSGRLGPRVPQRDVAQVAAGEPIPVALRAVEPPNINQSARSSCTSGDTASPSWPARGQGEGRAVHQR
jgi:hypothetical protein